MRISDWSSDVCSSDLAFANPRGGIVLRAVARAEITAVFAARLAFLVAQRHAAEMRADSDRDQPVLVAFLGALLERQIGRASRRERVCHYGVISEVTVSFKKHKR